MEDLSLFDEDFDVIDGVAEEIAEETADAFAPTVDSPTVSAEKEEEVVIDGKGELVEAEKQALGASTLGLDFSSLLGDAGVMVADTGIKISRFPVEKARFAKGEKVLISLLSPQVIVVKTHYHEDLGNFLCFGGKCCEEDLPRVRYLYPILRYTCNQKGKPISKDVTCQIMQIGQEVYDNLCDTQELKGDLTNYDFLVSCSDEQYQKIALQEAGPARYKSDEGMIKEIQEFWAKNSEHMLKAVARKVTEQEYIEKTSLQGTGAGAADVDFDSVFK